MFNKVKIDIGVYRKLIDAANNKSTLNKLCDEITQIREQLHRYQSEYIQVTHENRELHRENALLKKMFEEAEDTQAIKYNDKLFLIRSMAHYKEQGEEETLDIDAVYSTIKVEVNKNGEG